MTALDHPGQSGVGELHDGAHHDGHRAALLLNISAHESLPDGESGVVDQQVHGALGYLGRARTGGTCDA